MGIPASILQPGSNGSGISGAPRTFSFSGQTRLLKRSYILKQTNTRRQVYRPKSDGKVGLGGYIFSDKNGLIKRTGLQVSYSLSYVAP